MSASRSAFTTAHLTLLAHICGELSLDSGALLEEREGAEQLHAALHPLAAGVREHWRRCTPACAALGAACQAASDAARAAATAALLACLRSPRASFECVTLCIAGLALTWGCSRGGGAVAALLCDALAAPLLAMGEGCSSGSGSNALPAALSSGFVGLLNALSVPSGEEEGGMLLSDQLAALPVGSRALLACTAGLLEDSLQHCAEEGGGAAARAAAEAAGVPSPLAARAATGVRLLYASDARVAVDLALRGVEDAEDGGERACWARALRALSGAQASEGGGYRGEEVASAVAGALIDLDEV